MELASRLWRTRLCGRSSWWQRWCRTPVGGKRVWGRSADGPEYRTSRIRFRRRSLDSVFCDLESPAAGGNRVTAAVESGTAMFLFFSWPVMFSLSLEMTGQGKEGAAYRFGFEGRGIFITYTVLYMLSGWFHRQLKTNSKDTLKLINSNLCGKYISIIRSIQPPKFDSFLQRRIVTPISCSKTYRNTCQTESGIKLS
jgi:hypothetical protein